MSMYDSTETHGQIKIASVKIKILHAPHNLSARKKKKENRCCFEAFSEAITLHTHELMNRV